MKPDFRMMKIGYHCGIVWEQTEAFYFKCIDSLDEKLAICITVYWLFWIDNSRIRPGAKYFEKYSNTLQLLWLINDYNYITITGPVEM